MYMCALLLSQNYMCVLLFSHMYMFVLLFSHMYMCVLQYSHMCMFGLLFSHIYMCALLLSHNNMCVLLFSHMFMCVLEFIIVVVDISFEHSIVNIFVFCLNLQKNIVFVHDLYLYLVRVLDVYADSLNIDINYNSFHVYARVYISMLYL